MKKDYFAQYRLNEEKISDESVNRIKSSVREKIDCNDESEEIPMLKTKKRRIKPIIISAAIIATATVSAFSVNAATDGELFTTIKFFVNGEEKSLDDLNVIEQDDSTITFEVPVDEETDSGENVIMSIDLLDAVDVPTEKDNTMNESSPDSVGASTEKNKSSEVQ